MANKKVRNSKLKYDETKCPGGKSWIEHWENVKGRKPFSCAKNDCHEKEDLVGGHVYISGDSSERFIVPLCHTHNSDDFTEEFEVPDCLLVSMEKCEKCKK